MTDTHLGCVPKTGVFAHLAVICCIYSGDPRPCSLLFRHRGYREARKSAAEAGLIAVILLQISAKTARSAAHTHAAPEVSNDQSQRALSK